MNTQSRIYVTLSPRVRKALELCAALDGSSSASYAANLLSLAVFQDIERSVALREQWSQMEREALEQGSWEIQKFSILAKLQGEPAEKREEASIKSWMLAGSRKHDYEQGIDNDNTFNGKKSAYLRSKESEPEGFGTLMQTFQATAYRNKRLRYSAYVKSEEVENWAGLWMRVDGFEKGKSLCFDNMQNRPIKGTTEWQRFEIVLNVPQDSSNIAFGILLEGRGQVWISDIQFAEVTSDVPVTDLTRSYPDQPENLDFAV
jgi:hypothetical protein